MCGLIGVVRHPPPPDAAPELTEATRLLAPRGPDGEGFHRAAGVALGHRRLAVIDIEGGAQPFSDSEGRYHLVYNGEIYNYVELRRELEGEGWRFRSRSDTEVLLASLVLRGWRGLSRLNGIFAFGLWDVRERRLLLARDHLGIKPLFLADLPDGLAFASELKALRRLEEVDRELDPLAVRDYFTVGYALGNRTVHRGIRELSPGTALEWTAGEVRSHHWWDPRDWAGRGGRTTPQAARRLVREHWDEVVRRQLRSDVPVGVFLSGGVDSSLVTASAAERLGPGVETFTVRYEGAEVDETPFARMVAERYETRHRELVVGSADLERLPEIMRLFDEPCPDTALLPTYLLSALARERVKVVLTGEGGDELFGGYPTYRGERRKVLYGRLPAPVRSAVRLGFLMAGSRLRRRFAAFHDRAMRPLRHRYLETVRSMRDDLIDEILRLEAESSDTARRFEETFEGLEGAGWFNALSCVDMETYLRRQLLAKLDRMTMARGLEGRVPFLDRELVERVLTLPGPVKIPRGRLKGLLTDSLGDRLPAPLLRRRKQGFGAPIARWLQGPLLEEVEQRLLDGRKGEDVLEPKAVEALVGRFRAGETGLARSLWFVYAFRVWQDAHHS